MAAIDYVALEFNDDVSILNAMPTQTVLTSSVALTAERHYLVLGMAHCASTNADEPLAVSFQIGGVVFARQANQSPFGAGPHAQIHMSGRQLLFATTYTTATGSADTMQLFGASTGAQGVIGSARIYALNLTSITLNDGRWHSESPNADASGTSPTSGWTVLGSAGSGSLVFTPQRAGNFLIIGSCEVTASTSAVTTDEMAVRLTQNSNEVSGTAYFMDCIPVPVSGTNNYMITHVAALSASTEYTFSLQANGTNSNGNLGYRRIRMHALEAAAIEHRDMVISSNESGILLPSNTAIAVYSASLNPSGSARDYMLFNNFQRQTDWYDYGQFLINSGVVMPTHGFFQGNVDFGLTSADDMVLTHGQQLLRNVTTQSNLQVRLTKFTGGTSNQYGGQCARSGDGPMWCIALRLYSREPDLSFSANFSGSADFTGTYSIDSGLVRILSTVESMQAQINDMQTSMNEILQSVQMVSTNVVTGTQYYVVTDLSAPDEFYTGMGVILTSGSTGVGRTITGFNQTGGTIYFNERLPFMPISGSSVIIVDQYTPVGGYVN